jgi:uncharacterized protein YbbC (DUF1343 family)
MMAAGIRCMRTSLPAEKLIGRILWVVLACTVGVCAEAGVVLAGQVAEGQRAPVPKEYHGKVRTGIDVLEIKKFVPLRMKGHEGPVRVGVITNQTGVDRKGRRTIDVLAHAPGVKLVAIFSPEHGIEGKLDVDKVASGKDEATGLPVYSLYGETRRPTAEMLKGIDALVFDIQDAGVRFFTYTTTMAYAMEAAAKVRVRFIVLDRPNPLGGYLVEGPLPDRDQLKFTAYFTMPIIYGLTIGELAKMFNAENKIGADLMVVEMQGWEREEFFDKTGLKWIAPSPNLRTVGETLTYPALDILQAAGVSVGRGTDRPFEMFGAPWMDGEKVAGILAAREIHGVKFQAVKFTPTSDLYKGQECGGVSVTLTDKRYFQPVLIGIEIAEVLWWQYPGNFQVEKMMTLLGSRKTVEMVKAEKSVDDIAEEWNKQENEFQDTRGKYFIYGMVTVY